MCELFRLPLRFFLKFVKGTRFLTFPKIVHLGMWKFCDNNIEAMLHSYPQTRVFWSVIELVCWLSKPVRPDRACDVLHSRAWGLEATVIMHKLMNTILTILELLFCPFIEHVRMQHTPHLQAFKSGSSAKINTHESRGKPAKHQLYHHEYTVSTTSKCGEYSESKWT